MIVARIELENFGPFRGSHSIDLAGVHALAIVGANGGGKSSILDAVGYALYGRTRSRSADEWRSDGAPEMRVSLTLRGDGPDLTVERGVRSTRGGAPKGWVRVSGWEGAQARHADREVVRLVGLEWDDYLGTRCLAQGDLQRLGSASPGERRALVERWLARPVWARAAAALVERAGAARLAGTKAEAFRSAAAVAEARTTPLLERWAKRPPRERLEQELTRAGAAVAAQEARPPEPQARRELEAKVLRLRDAARAAATACNDFDGECPVLGAPCPVADQVRADTVALLRRRDAAAREWDAASDELQEVVDGAEEADRAWRQSRMPFQVALNAARDDLARWDAMEERGTELQATHTAALAELEAAHAWGQAFAHRLDVVGAAQRAVQALAAAEVEESVDAAERGAGAVLRALGSPLGVRFSHARDLREWAPSCASCGMEGRPADGTCRGCGAHWPRARRAELDLVVETQAGDRPFECVGGGQRDVVSLALRLAFSTGVGALGFVLADEVLRQLDRQNREAVAQLLLGGGARAVGIEQVLLVAHDPAAVAAAPRLLAVVPDGEGSRLEWLR